MRLEKVLIILFFAVSVYTNCDGQVFTPAFSVDVFLAKDVHDTTQIWGADSFGVNTLVKAQMVIKIDGSTIPSSVIIHFRTLYGQAELLSKTFNCQQPGTYSDGTSLQVSGNLLTIGLGNYLGLNSVYAEVVCVDGSGNQSPPVLYTNE